MKISLFLLIFGPFALLTSCNKKEEPTTGASGTSTETEQVEKAAIDLLSIMERLPAALLTIKDNASFVTAEKEIETIRAELAEKGDSFAKLPPISAEESKVIEERLNKAGEKVKEDMGKVMTHLQSLKDPELMMKVSKLMQNFGEDMQAMSSKINKVIKP